MKCMHPQHKLCRNRMECPLKYGNKYTSRISKDISFHLKQLDDLYSTRKLYEITLKDILRGVYTTAHAQYNKIPLLNVLNKPITSPADVYYNLDLDRIDKEIEVTKNTINELRTEEYKVIRTLKKRNRRSKEYGWSR